MLEIEPLQGETIFYVQLERNCRLFPTFTQHLYLNQRTSPREPTRHKVQTVQDLFADLFLEINNFHAGKNYSSAAIVWE